jgi:transposase
VEFLQALLAALPPGPSYLSLDNYGVHKSRRPREFLAGQGKRIHLVFLPTYAPWLNRIEATWRLVKAQAGTNAWRDTLTQLIADYQATLLALEAQILTPIPCFLSK